MNWYERFSTLHIKKTLTQPWLRKTGYLLLGLFLLFSLVLFFAGPPLLKSYLVENLSSKLGRKISVGAVHINPLMLSIEIDDFTLAERNGKTPFVFFKEVYVNAQLASIFFGGPVLGEIRMTEPYVNLVRTTDNTYNFQDIIDRLKKRSAAPDKKGSDALRFSLNNIRIISGRIDFDDQPKGRRHRIQDLKVSIPFLSNLSYRVDDYVLPEFSAVINSAPFRLTGRTKPFETDRESSLNLKLSKVALNEYLTYVPKKLYFSLPGGTLDADLKIAFLQPQGKAPSLQLSGSVALHDLVMNEAKDLPTIRLKSLDVALGRIEPLVKRFTVDRVVLDKLELFVRRDRQGRLNLASLVEPDKEKKPMPYFLLREGILDSAIVHVRDDSRTQSFEATLRDIHLLVRNITSEKDKSGQIEMSASGPEGSFLKAATDVVLEPFALSRLNAQVTDLRLSWPGSKTEMIYIGQFGIFGTSFSKDRHSIAVDEISLGKSRFFVQRDSKGALNLNEILGSSRTKPEAAPPGSAWQYEVKKLAVNETNLRWRDETPPSGTADIGIDHITATVENLSSHPNSAAKLSLAAQMGRKGRLDVDGSVVTKPQVSAKLQLKASGLPILPVQPYFADKVQVRISSGTISARGVLSAQLAEQAKISYQGEASVNHFASVDKVQSHDFLKWEGLHFGGVRVETAPMNVDIQEISLSNFYSRLIINPDGSINVQSVLGKGEASKEATAGKVDMPAFQEKDQETKRSISPKPTSTVSTSSKPEKPPAPVKIARISLQGGQVRFSDRFIKPNYSANLTQIGGRITGLTSNLATTADVEIRGAVDDTAPVFIQGKINPLSGNLFLDLTASAKGVDLPAATPYSATYAGYPIIKGKLSMDVHYFIENRKLRADNRVKLDQLTFGDKVESPKATKLPVLLAVALLKDRHGVIDVNLPISGSLDDPKFSIGGVIVKVLLNLISKAATAPFALLGSLVGGAEELSYIEFEPGRADLDKIALDKISSLSKTLADRPGLKLDITGRVDPSADREGLRRRMLERKLKAAKLKSLEEKTDSASRLEEIRIDPKEYPKLLKQVYGQGKFPKPRNVIGLAKDLPVEEMERLLLSHTTVTDDDLRQLGLRRARVVADAIVKNGNIASERVFVLEPKLKSEAGEKGPAEKAKVSRVDFSLK
ncbi:protein of unknown function [Syntrophus gentianae]|uniref:DUF748 domain-containing protein n=1 Tax=Syntrophus gentianae TaxID=43775 RepID=A0A1H7WVW0_9BACT|nr:DUF748 domain-containing protein [Syntrophus gentianae]SEM25571.1 protein of unknown function [Syntrophus gentianae]